MSHQADDSYREPAGQHTGTQDDPTKSRAPDPDDPSKPDSPPKLTKASWLYTLRKAVREFLDDQCMDLAAGLTYWSVLAIAPALLALVSILGVLGNSEQIVTRAVEMANSMGAPEDVVTQIESLVQNVTDQQGAGLALVTGLLVALWSASGYVNAFSRAMNNVYEVAEGRPVWKLRPIMIGITVVVLLLVVVVLAALVLSGPVAEAVGEVIGLGEVALTVWNIAKWPVVVLLVALIIAILYYATPNVQQPKFRWISVGSFVTIVVWALATVGFGFYVANFGNYDATYGSLGGVIVFLLWLWITNNVLLLGAEIDAELERSRQLQAGIAAEETLQLPPRDTTKIDKDREKEKEDLAKGRALRRTGGEHSDPDELRRS